MKVIIVGGVGSLGNNLIKYFKNVKWNITSIDFKKNPIADNSIELNKHDNLKKSIEKIMNSIDLNSSYHAVISTAGGWMGGKIGDFDSIDNFELMWKKNLNSAIITSHIAANYLDENGIAIITGAHAALKATPEMAAYGISKAATHHLIASLSKTTKACTFGILPVTIDTPENRNAMPNGNFSTWTKMDEIADQIYTYTTDINSRPPSGSLISIITKDNLTHWKVNKNLFL